MWRALLIAGRFLTRLPLPDPATVTDADLGRSSALYPLVGLVIGLLVWAMSGVVTSHYTDAIDLAAALVLVTWVWLTGGLHLDGLADTADAWIGGMGDRRRTLEIMKDPNAGPFAVTALVLVLLCKWTAVTALIGGAGGWIDAVALIWIPALARAQLLVLFLTTPYARPQGMGARISAHSPPAVLSSSLAITLGLSWLLLGPQTLALVLVGGVLFLFWRRALMKRLGGYTGDTAGALVELSETLMLVAACAADWRV